VIIKPNASKNVPLVGAFLLAVLVHSIRKLTNCALAPKTGT